MEGSTYFLLKTSCKSNIFLSCFLCHGQAAGTAGTAAKKSRTGDEEVVNIQEEAISGRVRPLVSSFLLVLCVNKRFPSCLSSLFQSES